MVRRTRFRGIALAIAGAIAVFAAAAPGEARAQCPPGRLFGAHAPYGVGSGPDEIVLSDFNEDGILDLATSSGSNLFGAPGKGSVSVRLGRGSGGVGDGSFAPAVNYAAGVRLQGLTTGDFDEDGITDIAAADYDGAQVVVLFGKGSAGIGDGTFASPLSFAYGSNPLCIATGDFNKDGITDLVFGDDASPGHTSVAVMLGKGDGGVGNGDFAPPLYYAAGGAMLDIVVSDFDEDGISDLAVTTFTPLGVAILKGGGAGGVGNGTFLPPVNVAVGLNPFAIVQGDFDEDGITDLATANHASGAPPSDGGSIWVMRGRGAGGVGDGTFDPAVSYPASSHAIDLVQGDWNADGILDLAVANAQADSITVLLGQGIAGTGNGAFGQPTSYHAIGNPIALASGDVNEDGHLDLVAAEFNGNDARVYLGACAPHTGAGPRIEAVKDAPSDQGGSVFIAWRRSPFDGEWGTIVRSYRVSRRIDSGDAWEELATLPAQRLEGYGYEAATEQDSTPSDNPYTAFRVTALTADAEMVFESTVDSGYSVDNLPPPPPEFLEARYAGSVALRWGAGSAADHASFRLYRGTSADFEPSPESLVAQLVATEYVDDAGTEASVYKLVAVDRHGNASEPVLASTLPGPPRPLALAITRTSPNPARGGRLTVSYVLPTDAAGSLELFDARGRRVATRRVAGAGEGTVTLPDERSALAPGVYVLRLVHEGRSVRAKSVVTR